MAAAALVALFGAPARGDDCARPDVVDTVPIDGARDVPTNATLIARYAIYAELLGEQVLFGEAGSDLGCFHAVVQRCRALAHLYASGRAHAGSRIRDRVAGPPRSEYREQGPCRKVHFFAGNAADSEPPSFDGLIAVDWDFERENDDCTDRIEERFVFDLDLGAAEDDGGRDSLSLVVFQTQGPTIAPDAPQPIHVGHFPAPGRTREAHRYSG